MEVVRNSIDIPKYTAGAIKNIASNYGTSYKKLCENIILEWFEKISDHVKEQSLINETIITGQSLKNKEA